VWRPCTNRDLAAHLVVREHDSFAGPGLVLPGAWVGWPNAAAGRSPRGTSPGWSRRSGRDRRLASSVSDGYAGFPNLDEFFVHHEDVRRANGRGPRTNELALDEALWRNIGQAPWFLARRLRGAGLELQWAATARTVRARRGEPTAYIAGPPGELLLYLFGRQRAAEVEIVGPTEAVEALGRARFGV
jgi:uncharacterized protein (TIGR03085 family)